MPRLPQLVLLLVPFLCSIPGLAQEIDYSVYTESPRLFLRERRLRLLKRERERESMRWAQFDALIQGRAQMGEPGFSMALYGIVSGQPSACAAAGEWAVKTANPALPGDLRQIALVMDWCNGSLGEALAAQIARRLTPALALRPTTPEMVRSAVLAAFVLADSEPARSSALLKYAIEDWWRKQIQPELKSGRTPFKTKAALFAAVEFLHAIRDNLRADLREGTVKWFEQLPPFLVLSYYPAPWPAAENEYRIPMYEGRRDPDLKEAALSRAAELALVAFDTNAESHQFLQGWLIQDRFLMRGPFGIAYEFLWANPYLPGLSYSYMPDQAHLDGVLLVRSSWDEDATWFGLISGKAQMFRNGARSELPLDGRIAPITLGVSRILFGEEGTRFETGWAPETAEDEQPIREEFAFIVGLDPSSLYDVEVDGEELAEHSTDSGGILALKFQTGIKSKVRLSKARPLAVQR